MFLNALYSTWLYHPVDSEGTISSLTGKIHQNSFWSEWEAFIRRHWNMWVVYDYCLQNHAVFNTKWLVWSNHQSQWHHAHKSWILANVSYCFIFSLFDRSPGEVTCHFPAQGWERLPHLLPDPVSKETRTAGSVFKKWFITILSNTDWPSK